MLHDFCITHHAKVIVYYDNSSTYIAENPWFHRQNITIIILNNITILFKITIVLTIIFIYLFQSLCHFHLSI